jgi:hypothetical protein
MRARLVLVLLALTGGLLVAPTQASAASTSRYAVITFHKNYKDTLHSRLTWQVVEVRAGKRTTVASDSWRAGSGFTRKSTNSCRKNNGWLPNGRYRPRLYRNYGGNLIKGRAIYLGAKRCSNGTMRTDLFIHTEQGANSTQCRDRKGDQPCRWEYPRINDYKSRGCIKLSPGDMRELYVAWRKYFGAGSPSQVRVQVR